MKLIPVLLNSTETNYRSTFNEELLKSKVSELNEQGTLSLKGSLKSEHGFSVYDTWNVVGWNMPGLKRKAAYLMGSVTQGVDGPRVNLKVKPNAILPVFGIVSTLIGLIVSIMALSKTGEPRLLWALGLTFFSVGLIYYILGSFLRTRLQNKLIKYLDLKLV